MRVGTPRRTVCSILDIFLLRGQQTESLFERVPLLAEFVIRAEAGGMGRLRRVSIRRCFLYIAKNTRGVEKAIGGVRRAHESSTVATVGGDGNYAKWVCFLFLS